MPLDIGDFLQDTAHLSATEVGAYMLMIFAYWARGGPLPNRDAYRRVSRMTARQWSSSGDHLMSYFGDDLRHGRLDKDLAHVIEKTETKSANALDQHRKRRENAKALHVVSTRDLRLETKKESDVVESARERDPAKPLAKVKVPAERREAIALGLAFLNAAGFEDYAAAPLNWYGVADRAAVWLGSGWSAAMIIAETRIVASRGGDTMPIKYFEKCFATAAARALQPVPIATIKPAETHDAVRTNSQPGNRSSVVEAGNRLIEQARRLEQGDGVSGAWRGDGVGGLLQNG